MQTIIFILMVVIAIIILAIRKNSSKPVSTSDIVQYKQMTLENKLDILADCGLKLAQPFTTDDLLKSWDREEYEKPGFELTLTGLSMTEEQEPWRPHCMNLWYLDTECIEDHGDYKRIVEHMAEITQGTMHFNNVEDYIDIEEEKAWFSFTFQGKEIKVDCKVNDDWMDTKIFSIFVRLLNNTDPTKIYIYYNLGGQDCIIGCVSKDALKILKSNGIKFEPLS